MAKNRAATKSRRPPIRPTPPPPRRAPVEVPVGLAVAAAWWVLVLLFWAGGGIHAAGEVAFFLVAGAGAGYVTAVAVNLCRGQRPLRAARRVTLLAIAALAPVVFASGVYEGWDSAKIIVIGLGAALLAGLWAVDLAGGATPPPLPPLLWPAAAALLLWTAVATVLSVSPVVSLVGHYDYFDGLLMLLALVVISWSASADVGAEDVESLFGGIVLGAGSLVVFYGLLQLHDRIWGGRWDWVGGSVAKGASVNVVSSIWSTFGNPNHLSGFLAILSPMFVLLALRARRASTWAALAFVGVGGVTELVQSTTRGAWLAIAAAGVVLLVVAGPTLRRYVRPLLVSAGALAATVVAAVALLGFTGHTRYDFRAVTTATAGPASSGSERLELWRSAVKVGLAHPISGTGPDTFADVLGGYQNARLVAGLGPESNPDGPHNVILNRLATVGFPGVLALLAVFAAGAALTVRAVRSATDGDRRLGVAVTAAAAAAFVVEACFNVQRVELTLLFWILLGVLAGLARDAVPTEGPAPPPHPGSRRARGRAAVTARRAAAWRQAIVAAAAGAVLVVTGLVVTRPLLAGASFTEGFKAELALKAAIAANDTAAAQGAYYAADSRFRHAERLDPADAFFDEARADFLMIWMPPASTQNHATRLTSLRTSEALLRRAISLAPRNARIEALLGNALDLDAAESQAPALHTEAIAHLRRAVALNPWVPTYPVALAADLFDAGDHVSAMAAVNRGLRDSPTDTGLLDARGQLDAGKRPKSPPFDVLPDVAV